MPGASEYRGWFGASGSSMPGLRNEWIVLSAVLDTTFFVFVDVSITLIVIFFLVQLGLERRVSDAEADAEPYQGHPTKDTPSKGFALGLDMSSQREEPTADEGTNGATCSRERLRQSIECS